MLRANLLAFLALEGSSQDFMGSSAGVDTAITYGAGNGTIKQGASFNGTTSQIVFADTAIWRVTSNFTVSFWINAAIPAAFGGIFWDSAQLATTSGILIGLGTDGKILFRSSSNAAPDTQGSQWQQLASTTVVANSTWRMVTCVWNGSNLLIYVNGVQDASIAWTLAPGYQTTNYPRLGSDDLTGGPAIDFFSGKLDEFGLWNRALSVTEILQLYNNGKGLEFPFEFQTSGLMNMGIG